MKRAINIFGLALILLFFTACGEKENSDEIKLPLGIKQNKGLQRLAVKVSELPNLTDENSSIEKAEDLVAAQILADSQPEYFDTYNSEDTTTETDVLPKVNLYGKAIRADVTAVTNALVRATPLGLYESTGNPGHVPTTEQVDESGYFEISGLIPEHYKLYICADDSDSITTNVVIYSDSANDFEFIFPKITYRMINGIVKYEITDKPAEGIEIKYESGTLHKTIITGIDGKFKFTLPIVEKQRLKIKIHKTGYAQVNWGYYLPRFSGEQITLLLKKAGHITGKITNKSGKPLSGIRVSFYPKHEFDPRSKISLSSGRANDFDKHAYIARTETPSSVEGIYVISNVAAPEVYTLKDVSGWNEYLPRDSQHEEIKVFPGKTTIFDFEILSKPVIKIQVKDEKGNPILKYTLTVLTKYMGSYRPQTHNVNLSNENDWHTINVLPRNREANLSLTAKAQDGQMARKNNIKVETGKTYELTLKAGENPPDVAGFVYNSDMTPCIDRLIRAKTKTGFAICKTDHLGYFELSGLNVEKGTKIFLSMREDNIFYSSRVCAGNNNFEWILPELKLITGRVCIESCATPATNFAVSVRKPYNKKYFHSNNGTFSIQVNPQLRRKFKVYVFASGYATKSREINLHKINSYGLGDIILMNKPATVIGKVLDWKNNPVNSKVILENINNSESSMRAMTDSNDGSFEFTEIPPGRYIITASSQSNKVESETFELHSDEYYILPDLILSK